MRIIRRTLAILAAAMIVVGITFSLAQSSNAQTLAPARPERNAAVQNQSTDGTTSADTAGTSGAPDQSAPAGGFEHEGNRSPSLFGAVEIVKNLVVVGIIVALVSLVAWALRRRRPKGGAKPPQAPPTATPAM